MTERRIQTDTIRNAAFYTDSHNDNYMRKGLLVGNVATALA